MDWREYDYQLEDALPDVRRTQGTYVRVELDRSRRNMLFAKLSRDVQWASAGKHVHLYVPEAFLITEEGSSEVERLLLSFRKGSEGASLEARTLDGSTATMIDPLYRGVASYDKGRLVIEYRGPSATLCVRVDEEVHILRFLES